MGSGKHLKRAIKKYGIDSFQKNILFSFNNENEMNAKEKELVTKEFCNREDTYNICEGGKGGFGYINSLENIFEKYTKEQRQSNLTREGSVKGRLTQKYLAETVYSHIMVSSYYKSIKLKGRIPTWSGRSHTSHSKQKIGLANKKMTGQKNSQYGTMWITNGEINKKIKKTEILPKGFRKGRV